MQNEIQTFDALWGEPMAPSKGSHESAFAFDHELDENIRMKSIIQYHVNYSIYNLKA